MQKRKDLGFSGTVERLKLQDIIQMACVGGITSTITASRGNQKGYLYIQRGNPWHASAAGVTGQEALNELLSWSGGRFDLRWGVPRNLAQNLSGSHDAMLLEAMRVLDERSSGPDDAENDEKRNVELSRDSAAAVLELIYARRRQERWQTRIKKALHRVCGGHCYSLTRVFRVPTRFRASMDERIAGDDQRIQPKARS